MATVKKRNNTGSFSAAFKLNKAAHIEAEQSLVQLRAQYGFLKSSHKLVQYMRNLLKEVYPDVDELDLPQIEVLASSGFGVNAMSYPDGTQKKGKFIGKKFFPR